MGRQPAESTHSELPSRELLERARAGDERALSVLFRRNTAALLRWARGRLPRWARGVADTRDIVQDVLLQTFRRLEVFEDRGKGALQAYLRRAVDNRINDELRRVCRRPTAELADVLVNMPSSEPSPVQHATELEAEHRYKAALATLTVEERRLIVGRLELGYNYEQLAAITNRPTAEAARVAVRRAVEKLAKRIMSG